MGLYYDQIVSRLTGKPSSGTNLEFALQEETMYNLTEKQKDALRWIIKNVREKNLAEEFTFVQAANGDTHFVDNGAKNISNPPALTDGLLNALAESSLVFFNKSERGLVRCTLLGEAYKAVDFNFDEPLEPQILTIANPIFGQPNKQYTYDLFVLMPFVQDLKPIYDIHIKKVAKSRNLSIARADNFFSQDVIIEEIWSAIVQATILIADCTNKNANVFYEIGLAHAAGKPVILITQNPDDVPFDLRHRRYIQYTFTPLGMGKFESDLSATIFETLKDLGSIS